jgi:hypothetical protein
MSTHYKMKIAYIKEALLQQRHVKKKHAETNEAIILGHAKA